jgi:hypothetical protein
MYNKWKERGQMQAPQEPGSLRTAALGNICAGIQEHIQQGIGDSNGITHKDVGKVLEEVVRKKEEADGLDQKTVDAAVTQRTAKRYLIALSMKVNEGDGVWKQRRRHQLQAVNQETA